ncbi:MAG: AAA family ATPase, partial [Lentisphaeria bacterium]|nr:AAA family ATPase [Lentisphaeria bacterium]
MIIREHYLEKIRPFLGKPVVKAITGMRRVGKSVFVRQIMEQLSTEGVAQDAIVYVDMESLEYDFIRDYRALNDHVIARSAHVSGKIHVLID